MAKTAKTTKTTAATVKAAKPKAVKAQAAAMPSAVKRIETATPAQINEWWDAPRAKRIIDLMKSAKLPYWRAVKRSRRHMVNAGEW